MELLLFETVLVSSTGRDNDSFRLLYHDKHFMPIHAIVSGMGVIIEAATGTTLAMSLYGGGRETPSKTIAIPVFWIPVSMLIAVRSRFGRRSIDDTMNPPKKPVQTQSPADMRMRAFIRRNMYRLAYVPKTMMKTIIATEIGARIFLQYYSKNTGLLFYTLEGYQDLQPRHEARTAGN